MSSLAQLSPQYQRDGISVWNNKNLEIISLMKTRHYSYNIFERSRRVFYSRYVTLHLFI